jgi:hypothetical protein
MTNADLDDLHLNIPDSYRLAKADFDAATRIFERYALRCEPLTIKENELMELALDTEHMMAAKKLTKIPTVGEVRAWDDLQNYKKALLMRRVYDRRSGIIAPAEKFFGDYRATIEREQKAALNGG